MALDIMKTGLKQCNNFTEAGAVISCTHTPNWPIYIKDKTEEAKEMLASNKLWWTEGFGGTIRSEWYIMIDKFIKAINDID